MKAGERKEMQGHARDRKSPLECSAQVILLSDLPERPFARIGVADAQKLGTVAALFCLRMSVQKLSR